MDKLFLDANILFSAAYKENSCLLEFWHLHGISLISSGYAIEEARRNLSTQPQLERLLLLNESLEIITEYSDSLIPSDIQLKIKDRPILAAAIAAYADFLITGDKRDFGHLYEKIINNVMILPPSTYLSDYCNRRSFH